MQRALCFADGLCRDDDGEDLVEYGLLAALIAVVTIAAVTAAGQRIAVLWQAIANVRLQ